jgi:predicted glycoside hydrolase/deacetylase ChbG (UPF0249 family)
MRKITEHFTFHRVFNIYQIENDAFGHLGLSDSHLHVTVFWTVTPWSDVVGYQHDFALNIEEAWSSETSVS